MATALTWAVRAVTREVGAIDVLRTAEVAAEVAVVEEMAVTDRGEVGMSLEGIRVTAVQPTTIGTERGMLQREEPKRDPLNKNLRRVVKVVQKIFLRPVMMRLLLIEITADVRTVKIGGAIHHGDKIPAGILGNHVVRLTPAVDRER